MPNKEYPEMTTFRVTDRKIPRTPGRAKKVIAHAHRVRAKSPVGAAKGFYIEKRQESHVVGRGHRFPPSKPSQVKVLQRWEEKVNGKTVLHYEVGQPRKDGVVTHPETISVVTAA